GLSMFAQFALAPLVVVYLAILYPYAAKIIWLRAWPNGWVSLPILCLAVAGILAALFLHPIRQKPDERWAAWYWTWFFRALFPLTVLLYLAVRVRVSEYGLTESRYFGFVLAGWLAWTSAYYWWSANRSIRWLPASLAALCLLTTWGPWGAFSMSERSQLARLETKLAAHGLLVDGLLTPKPQDLDGRDYRDLESLLHYLRSRHDSAGLDRLLAPYRASRPAAAKVAGAPNPWAEPREVLAWLGTRNASRGPEPRHFTVQIGGDPGAIGTYARAGVIWNLSRSGRSASPEIPGWPRFQLDHASGGLVALTTAGPVLISAVGDALGKAAAAPRTAGEKEYPAWEQMAVPCTIEGHDYLLVIIEATGQIPANGRVQVDSLSLLVLAR
ncbi:MAG: DUF4153 domain-containing protein, partial [Opitutaceae bacterium]